MELVAKIKSIQWSRNFSLFALASFVSGAGNALIPIAFSVESLRLDPSGAGIAIVMLTLWVGRFTGMLVYRKTNPMNLKSTVIGADLIRLLAQFGLLIYILSFTNSISAMVLSALIYGLASSFFLPANFQIIPRITEQKYREEANSILSILSDIYSIIGPLAGASLVIFLGFETVLIIDSISFLVAIVLIGIIKLPPSSSQTNDNNSCKYNQSLPATSLPNWSINGLKSWFFVSIAIGFLGVAAPAIVIQNHSEVAWAVIATSIAIGSLVGSIGALGGYLKNKTWREVHLVCLFLLPLQLITVSNSLPVIAIAISALFGALTTTASGIKWDTFTQNILAEDELSRFGSSDQIVTNTAVPIGMVLFGLASHYSLTGYAVLTIVVIVMSSAWFIRAGNYDNKKLIHD